VSLLLTRCCGVDRRVSITVPASSSSSSSSSLNSVVSRAGPPLKASTRDGRGHPATSFTTSSLNRYLEFRTTTSGVSLAALRSVSGRRTHGSRADTTPGAAEFRLRPGDVTGTTLVLVRAERLWSWSKNLQTDIPNPNPAEPWKNIPDLLWSWSGLTQATQIQGLPTQLSGTAAPRPLETPQRDIRRTCRTRPTRTRRIRVVPASSTTTERVPLLFHRRHLDFVT